MRHPLRSAVAGLVSAVMVAGLMAATPAHAATAGFSGVSKPKISGTKAVGKKLTAKPDTKTRPKATSRTYQWLRGGAVIQDATEKTYTLTASDKGKRISVKVCYAKAGYAKKCVTSSRTKKVAYGRFSGVSKPGVGGAREVGSVLTAEPDSKTSPKTTSFTYRWYRNGNKISKATKASHVLTKSDQGKTISVKVCHKASGYTAKCVTSARTGKIKAATVKAAPGTVWAWGSNERGQLGDGTTKDRDKPVQVQGLTGVTAVSAGQRVPSWHGYVYAIKKDRSVWAWGDNTYGELDGLSSSSPLGKLQKTPVPMTGLTNVAAIDDRAFCRRAVKKDGTVWEWAGAGCMGNTLDGAWGNEVVGAYARFPDLAGVKAISAGVALKSDGTVWTFTEHNEDPRYQGPQYQDPRWGDILLIRQVPGLTGVTAISGDYLGWSPHGTPESGYYSGSAYALKSDGTVWAWGNNRHGQLGDGTTIEREAPVQVSGLTGVTLISAAGTSAFAVKKDGTTWAWGRNANYNLGDGTDIDRRKPVKIAGLTGVTAIAPPLAVKKDGTVWGWGCQLNCGVSEPVKIAGLAGVVSVSAGGGAFYAVVGE